MKTTYHRNSAITYWSTYNQVWIRHANSVPDRELAAMGCDERKRVLAHITRYSA